jgi:hypothetical protein
MTATITKNDVQGAFKALKDYFVVEGLMWMAKHNAYTRPMPEVSRQAEKLFYRRRHYRMPLSVAEPSARARGALRGEARTVTIPRKRYGLPALWWHTTQLSSVRQGIFPAYAWPGGYSVRYFDGEAGDTLCAPCARAWVADGYHGPDDDDDRPLVRLAALVQYVHWEGPPECCAECNSLLDSEYGEADDDD